MNKVYEENCETIDGVKGQWLTVKESNKVSSGQRVRYSGKCVRFGYTECETVVVQDDGNVSVYWGDERVDSDLFSGYWKNIQAWFPSLPVERKQAKKVAKVKTFCFGSYFKYEIAISKRCFESTIYTEERNAIKAARSFCELIGYECEIVK